MDEMDRQRKIEEQRIKKEEKSMKNMREAPKTCPKCGKGKLIVTGETIRCSKCAFKNIAKKGKHIVVDDDSFKGYA